MPQEAMLYYLADKKVEEEAKKAREHTEARQAKKIALKRIRKVVFEQPDLKKPKCSDSLIPTTRSVEEYPECQVERCTKKNTARYKIKEKYVLSTDRRWFCGTHAKKVLRMAGIESEIEAQQAALEVRLLIL
jgi:hypothetical protein